MHPKFTAYLILALAIAVELPKLATIGSTASTRAYGLQTVPAYPLWTVVHVFFSMALLAKLVIEMPAHHGRSTVLLTHQFDFAQFCFAATVLAQGWKLSALPWPLAVLVNVGLLALLEFARRQHAGLYLAILSLPVWLTAIAVAAELHAALALFTMVAATAATYDLLRDRRAKSVDVDQVLSDSASIRD